MRKGMAAFAAVLIAMTFGMGTAVGGSDRVLGPDGYKGLKLGQSQQAAEATGLLRDPQRVGTCTAYYFMESEGSMPRSSGVFVGDTGGVIRIGGTSLMRTPEGAHDGMALEELKRRYPELKQDPQLDFIWASPLPDAEYSFVIQEDGTVKDFGLQRPGAQC
ncbi:hypothetical protein D5S17_13000 [Pseudonocardiaceae bacterium YIM PH 21723]|nr:hypothetical protein D5S17_13000 [Pseudonocardiaceae bacterium YIM PH 21723]